MKYRALGRTGIQVSELSFGGSSLGGAFGEVTQVAADEAVGMALDAGINLFDTSPHYGVTRAETVLGTALRNRPRDSYYLSTKCGQYGPGNFDFSPERVTRSVDESLKRLRTDHVDLLFCHDIEFVDIQPIITETLPALFKLKEQGKARFIGVSGFPLKIFPTVLDQIDLDVILAYCHYTLQNQRLNALIPYLREKGVGIVSAAPLGMRLLSNKPLPDWHPAQPEIREAMTQARLFCESKGVDIAQLALEFALETGQADTTLLGIATPDEVERNLRGLSSSISTEIRAEVLQILEPVRDRVWHSGKAENN